MFDPNLREQGFPLSVLPILRRMENFIQNDCSRPAKWMGLRFLIPFLLLTTFVADISLRSMPPRMVFFRAWEAARLFATAGGPFAPNFHYENDRSYGDLSNMANLPRFRQYHREVFTTDNFGFRNMPGANAGEIPAAILVGDSFGVGSGVPDNDTLSAQLTNRLSDGYVYNGATDQPSWNTTNELIQRLHMRGGLIIWEVSERTLLPESVRAESSNSAGIFPPGAWPSSKRNRAIRAFTEWADSLLIYSPLKTFLIRGFRKIENDELLPNPSADLCQAGRLRNGDSMLFLDSEVDNFYWPVHEKGAYFSEISALVHGTGNELLVLLVPDKYGVYYPLLSEKKVAPLYGQFHLNYLEKELVRQGIHVVNLMAPFRSHAAEGLQKREYNYSMDDTHWNRSGIGTAAAEVMRAWSNSSGVVPRR